MTMMEYCKIIHVRTVHKDSSAIRGVRELYVPQVWTPQTPIILDDGGDPSNKFYCFVNQMAELVLTEHIIAENWDVFEKAKETWFSAPCPLPWNWFSAPCYLPWKRLNENGVPHYRLKMDDIPNLPKM